MASNPDTTGTGIDPRLAHEIVRIPSHGQPRREELLKQSFDVRITTFHHEQGFPLETEIDESVSNRVIAARPADPLTIFTQRRGNCNTLLAAIGSVLRSCRNR